MGNRQPKSEAQLQRLCELYSELGGKIAAGEEKRDAAIARANVAADADLAPLIKERDLIEEKVRPYFMANREKLLPAKGKSVELGGCILGSRQGTDKVELTGEKKAVLSAMLKLPWAKKLLQVNWSVNKAKVKQAIEANRKDELAELGVKLIEGEETFFMKRTEQGRTQAKA